MATEEVDRLMRNAQRQMELEEGRDESAGPSRSRRQRAREERERSGRNKKLFTQLTHRRNRAVYANVQAEKRAPVDGRASASGDAAPGDDH